ncbi:MAG: cache domain-containing protein, partial [Smithella sp.]
MSGPSAFQSLMKVLGRFRVIVVLMVIVALGVTAVAFMGITRREVTKSMLARGDAEARNIMRVVMLDLANQEAGLEFFRNYARARYEQQLRDLVFVVVAEVDFFHELYEKGVLTEAQARKSALEAVQRARYGNNDYFFIYDRNNIAVSHADPRIRGRDMSETTDVKGRPVAKTMWKMSKQ